MCVPQVCNLGILPILILIIDIFNDCNEFNLYNVTDAELEKVRFWIIRNKLTLHKNETVYLTNAGK